LTEETTIKTENILFTNKELLREFVFTWMVAYSKTTGKNPRVFIGSALLKEPKLVDAPQGLEEQMRLVDLLSDLDLAHTAAFYVHEKEIPIENRRLDVLLREDTQKEESLRGRFMFLTGGYLDIPPEAIDPRPYTDKGNFIIQLLEEAEKPSRGRFLVALSSWNEYLRRAKNEQVYILGKMFLANRDYPVRPGVSTSAKTRLMMDAALVYFEE